MLCHQCGSPVEKSDKQCPNCGADLKKSVKRFDVAQSKGLRISQQIKAIKLDEQLFPPGEKLSDRFVLAEMLGKGPFGEVYRATDELIDDDVAVKIFRKELIKKPQNHEQFLNATRTARSQTQANLVRLHDSGVHKDHPWVSMQYLEGLSLRKVLELRKSKGQHFELDELQPMITQVTEALQRIKSGPHGDLKPENIIFMPDLMKVSDSYVFAAFDKADFVDALEDSAYIAPELLSDDAEATARADVYSMGVIIGEMVFGSDYTPGSTVPAELAAIDTLCKRATAFDPQERYKSVKALGKELETLISTGSLLASPPPAPPATGKIPAPPKSSKIPAPPKPPKGAPAPPEPPPAPIGDDEYQEATESQIIEVSEEDLATLDYSRDPEIQDLLPTNEVDREKHPVPETRRSVTKTAVTAPPKGRPGDDKEGPGSLPYVVGVIAFALIVLLFYGMNNNKKDKGKVVELGTNTKVQKDAGTAPATNNAAVAEKPDAGAADAGIDPQKFLASATMASSQVDSAKTQAIASLPAAQPDMGSKPEETPETDKPEVNEPEKPTKPENVVAVNKPETKPEEKPAAAGTKCPSGMALIKSKSDGNYCIDKYEYPGRSIRPKNVNWFQATKTCKSKGKRLCKLKEWKKACGSRYPYGRRFDPNKCNTQDEDGFERAKGKAGAFKRCRSSSGAYDMSGNVFEWVEEQRVAGGSFESDEEMASCRYSSPKSPRSAGADVGFRCCANPE